MPKKVQLTQEQLVSRFKTMTPEQIAAEFAAMSSTRGPGLGVEPGPSGGLSIYGYGRNPITIYASVAREIVNPESDLVGALKEALTEYGPMLAEKDDTPEVAQHKLELRKAAFPGKFLRAEAYAQGKVTAPGSPVATQTRQSQGVQLPQDRAQATQQKEKHTIAAGDVGVLSAQDVAAITTK